MKFRRLTIALVSLAITLAIAFVYDREFVVILDYDANESASLLSRENDDSSRDVIESQVPELLPLFPNPDDWRRASANVVVPAGRECVFLSKGGPILSPDQKTIALNACTLVFLGSRDPNLSEQEQIDRSLVFESTDKIELTFSDSLANVAHLTSEDSPGIDFSKFVSGRMRGEVVLRTKLGGADVMLKTRDVVFNATQIHTNFEVFFSIGPNSGAGKGLTIDLDTPLRFGSRGKRDVLADEEAPAPEAEPDDPFAQVDEMVDAGNIGGGFSLKGIQLNELDGCLKFYGDSFASIIGTDGDDEAAEVAEADDDQSTGFRNAHVEARCKSSVYFSSNANVLGGWCVRFNKDVELVGFQNGARSNQLLCDTLYLYFQDPSLDEFAGDNQEIRDLLKRKRVTGSLGRLAPTTIRALRGEDSPAIARDFPNNVQLEADEIRYDVVGQSLDLASENDELVRITQSSAKSDVEFTARHIQAQFNAKGEIERVAAGREGTLQANLFDETGRIQPIVATWGEGLYAAPAPEKAGYLKITSSGAVSFVADQLGSFYSEEGDFWCRLGDAPENPDDQVGASAPADPNVPPSFSIKALQDMKPILADFRGNVTLDSPRAKASVSDSVAIRFDSVQSPGAPDAEGGVAGTFAEEENGARSAFAGLEESPDAPTFEFEARKLEALCLLRYLPNKTSPEIEATRLTMRDSVAFYEKTPDVAVPTMEIHADAVQIDNPTKKDAMKLRMLGAPSEPASFRTDKLALVGSDVAVDSRQNCFQVLGPGELEANKPADEGDGQTTRLSQLAAEGPIKVRWTDSMQFDGQKLRFLSMNDQYVSVTQGERRLLSPEVALTLKNPLSIFNFDFNNKETLEVELVECLGDMARPIQIDAVVPASPDSADRRASSYRAFARKLQYRVSTGEFAALGGGDLYAIVPSTGESLESFSPIDVAREQPESTPKSTAPTWTKIRARFQGDATGSVASQETSIADGVQALVATVSDPNAPLELDAPENRPETAAYIEGNQAFMRVVRGSDGAKETQDVELEVRDGVVFKQKDITGLCASLRYASKKNLVVLSGSSANKAAIYRQEYQGAERERLGEFARAVYQLDTRKLSVDSFTHTD